MLLPVMAEMAALTERLQIARPVVGRIVIHMRRRQDHLGLPELSPIVTKINPVDRPALSVPPDLLVRIEPAPIAEMADHLAVGTIAALASPPCPLEPDHPAEFAPVDRIETFELRLDRHLLPLRLGQARFGKLGLPIEIREHTIQGGIQPASMMRAFICGDGVFTFQHPKKQKISGIISPLRLSFLVARIRG